LERIVVANPNQPEANNTNDTAGGPFLGPSKPIVTLALAAILATVSWYGLSRIKREYPPHWARLLIENPVSESASIDLQRALTQISDDVGPKLGSKVPLAEFVQSDGSRIHIVLVEGQFFDRSIEPQETWRNLGQSLLLVSSVDERRSSIGNLSSPTTTGCEIPDDVAGQEATQQLGSASINECRGIYSSRFHIHRLARMSVIVEASGTDDPPCWTRYGISAREGDYETCVSNAVASGLSDLFQEVSKERSVDALIVPQIATGTGKLTKRAFYNKLLVETLVPQLNQRFYIPPTIYLQVWRGDPDKRWPETKVAIAGALSSAVKNWDFKEHKRPDSEWLTVTGVAIGCCLVALALACGARSDIFLGLLPILSPLRPLLVVSWIAVAVGLVSVFKVFFGLFPAELNPYVQLGAGILSAFLSGPISRAQDTVKNLLKKN
jgi:hypothetical protein